MLNLRRFVPRLATAYGQFSKDECSLAAAGIAYYVALSFFPLLLVLVAGLGVVLEGTATGQDARKQLLDAISQQASPDLANQVGRALQNAGDQASAGGPIGFVILLISAVAIFAQVDAAFDRIWNVKPGPDEGWVTWLGRRLFKRVKSLLMLIGLGAFVLMVMVASMVWTAVQAAIEPNFAISPNVRWASSLGINVALNLFAFTVFYFTMPKARVRWLEALRGGIVAAILWEVGRQALSAYLLRLNYPSAYGIIGSFIAIMLWAYYAMLILLYGAQYVRVLGEERADGK